MSRGTGGSPWHGDRRAFQQDARHQETQFKGCCAGLDLKQPKNEVAHFFFSKSPWGEDPPTSGGGHIMLSEISQEQKRKKLMTVSLRSC